MNTPERPPEVPPPPPPPSPQRRAPLGGDARAILSAAGPLFFLPPVMALADRAVTVLGVPLIAVYVFAVWLAGIVLIALSAQRGQVD